ncbi:kinase-like protein [Delitschia confertaspora ATCC 74209]|uniref:non-specific serine/threonine protein kinase n=1 Tax=Delitschia confertaspora ATCC 74209 TaxID=1513339 RepID=A0A9P4JGF6_9PLEO|nr:kinase-like protein [Delitschia confertaspora ATCC 74209]
MADERRGSMSLVPYVPADSREVVLRHGSSVVVFDQNSKQLSLRDASHSSALEIAECPYCHRAFREEPHHDMDDEDEHEHEHRGSQDSTGFVNPSYFQMLRRSRPGSQEPSRPPSPHKQIAHRPSQAGLEADYHAPESSGFGRSAPVPPRHQGISARAFSPNYFKTFFVEEKELGRGGKGVVLLVRHVLDGVPLGQFACKRVPVGDDHEWLEKVLIEVQLLQNLSHQNLVSYRHVWLEDYQISPFGPSVPCAFILQQYCNHGDLHNYILSSARKTMTTEQMKERLRRRSKGQLEEPQDLHGPRRLHWEEIVAFFKDITSGLNHLHVNGYIHRDLKPSNCLLHDTGHGLRVLVSDFGEVQAANVNRNSTGSTGTISYCAPEVLRRVHPGGPFGNFTTKSDIFSLGMIVYFMCFARLPYHNADGIDEDNEDIDRLREEIVAWGGYDGENPARKDLPDKLYRSLKHLLSLNPNERPEAGEILQAFKSPAVFEEFTGFAGSSGLDNLGPRISRADSPTPAPSPNHRKKSSVAAYKRPGPSKLSNSVSSSTESESPSPPPENGRNVSGSGLGRRLTPPDATTVMLRPRRLSKRDSHSPAHSPTRLMLPPPNEQHSMSLLNRILRYLSNPTFISIAKILLFCLKVVSVFSPCQPIAARPSVAYPLICFAALDIVFFGFTVGERQYRLGGSLVLFLLHVAIVGLLLRQDKLCVKKGVWTTE